MARITNRELNHRAWLIFNDIGLDTGPVYVNGKARIGATYLAKSASGWSIEQITNEGGGVRSLSGYGLCYSAAQMDALLMGMRLSYELMKKQAKAS
jgi:hypothetical protein